MFKNFHNSLNSYNSLLHLHSNFQDAITRQNIEVLFALKQWCEGGGGAQMSGGHTGGGYTDPLFVVVPVSSTLAASVKTRVAGGAASARKWQVTCLPVSRSARRCC